MSDRLQVVCIKKPSVTLEQKTTVPPSGNLSALPLHLKGVKLECRGQGPPVTQQHLGKEEFTQHLQLQALGDRYPRAGSPYSGSSPSPYFH